MSSPASFNNIELAERVAQLPPEKQKALLKRLLDEGLSPLSIPVVPQKQYEQGAPLSYSQRRLWFLDQMQPGIPYYLPQAARIHGKLNVPALVRSFAAIQQRHEILRTAFIAHEGDPYQLIRDTDADLLKIVDLRALPAEQVPTEAENRALAEVRLPFDLASGPMIRASLLQLSDEEFVLLTTPHHIVFDGWSIDLFARELATLYAADCCGEPAQLEPLAVQYADFAAWQRQWLSNTALAPQLQYWEQKLAGMPGALDMPTDFPRPQRQQFNGGLVRKRLDRELTRSVHALSRESSATPFMTLLTAYSVMLGWYSGQDDVVVGSPVAGRNRPEVEPLIGFFLNNLVLRTRMPLDHSFRTILSEVRQSTLDAFANQDLPFEQLVEHLQPDRDLARSPLFQNIFVLQNMRRTPFSLEGLTVEPVDFDYKTAWFDLSLTMFEEGGRFDCALEYSADLYKRGTAERFLDSFEQLLARTLANPDLPLSQLDLILPQDRIELGQLSNDASDLVDADASFPAMFERQVAAKPDRIGLSCGKEQLSYGELDRRANQLANWLHSRGAGPDQLIGLYVDRTPDMLVGLLGIMKAGAAYVPMDPAFPAERLHLMLEDAGISIVLTQSHLAGQLRMDELEVVAIDNAWEKISNAPPRPMQPGSPDNLAYTIFTSGSTGRPKGVAVTHRNLVNFLCSMKKAPGMHEHDRLLSVTTLSFDIAALELFLPLICGAAIDLVPRETAFDPVRLSARIDRMEASIMQATPATWRMLLDDGWAGRDEIKILCGGEALPPDLGRALLDRAGSLWNMYGPTETTIWSGALQISNIDKSVPVGGPIANTQLYVLDRMGVLRPPGAVGELCIGGAGLARGYLNRPGLTADKFMPDALASASGARRYRTGDVVRYVGNDHLEFSGRLDHQVKIRGFRVELGEIETLLRRLPRIRQAVVVSQEEHAGHARLIAYVTGENIQNSELQNALGERLPEYMVPSVFVVLDTMPLTPNGKIDRNALPQPEVGQLRDTAAFKSAETVVEKELAVLWCELLNIDEVGTNDQFFQLGGHSLMATRLISQIRTRFGVTIDLQAFFLSPTIQMLADSIEAGLLNTSSQDELDEMLSLLEEVDDQEADRLLTDDSSSPEGR